MGNPKISVLLPFYNCEETLEEAIESIIDQSFNDFELLLIDNGSTDNCSEIANVYASKDKRIVLLNESRTGIGYALNTGLEEAKGQYIARMDADDLSQPDRFEKQFNFLEENSDIGLVSSRVRHVAKDVEQQTMLDSVIWSNKVVTHEEISVSRFVEPPVVHSTVFYRKELIDKYGLYQPGDFPTDYEICLRFLEKGVKMEKLPDYLVEWYDYPERVKRYDDRFNMQAYYEIKSHYLYRYLNECNAWQPFVVVWGAGRVSRRYFSYLHELGIWPKFFIDIHANEERNVIQYKHTPPAGNHFILSYVTNRGARENIREFLVDLGYIEGKDFLCL